MPQFQERREALRRLLAEAEINGLLVTDELNVTYLTGFTGDSSYLLVSGERELLITDGRYTQQLSEECPGLELAVRMPGTQLPEYAAEVTGKVGLPSVGIEADEVTVSFFEKLREALKATPIANTSGIVESLREIKDAGEIVAIREAVAIAEGAFAAIRRRTPPRRELERAGAPEFGQLAGLLQLALQLAKETSIAPGLVTVPSAGPLLDSALRLTSPEFPCAKPMPRLGLGGLAALAGISPVGPAGWRDPAQELDFATSAVRELTLSLAPRGDVLEQMEQQAFPFTDGLLALAAPHAAFGRIVHRDSEFSGFRSAAPQAPEAPSAEAQPLALAASAGMFALAGAIAPRDWRAPMAAAVSNIEPRFGAPEIDLPAPRSAVHDPLVDLLSAVGCAPQRRLTAPDLRVYAASPASRPVVYQALPATGVTHIPAYTAGSHDFALRTLSEQLFSLRALGEKLQPRHDLRLRAGFPAEPSSGEALLPKHKLQLRKWKQAPRVEAALLAEDQPVRRLTTGVAEFWNHAPRDLKMLLFAVPLALGLAFHPSLPKVSVQSPGSDTKAITAQFSEVLNTQMASLRKTMADRAAVGLDENFRQGLDNWMGNSGSTAEWSFDQAGFVQPGRVALYQPSLGLTDYEFQFLGAIDKGALSWVSRAVDFQNYYVVKLVILKGGPVPAMGITRYAVINGQPVDRVDTPVTFQTRTDSLYRVSQVMDGDHFSLVIQGQMIDSWSDPRLKRGGIGFFTNRGEQSRIGWVQITHQYDTLGRLFAYLAP